MATSNNKYNIDEMEQLFQKACKFNDGADQHGLQVLYRDKTKFEIKDGVLHTAKKDRNGDPRAPMNNMDIDGIFFGANINFGTGKPMTPSLYGTKRIQVPIEYFLNKEEQNLYFADFYCMTPGNINHYVTLVIAEDGSEEDQSIAKELYPLSMTNNRFLGLDKYGNPYKKYWHTLD